MDTTGAPTITAAVPGSFEWDVFHERHPKLIRQVLDTTPYTSVEQALLQQLLVESTTGVIKPLPETAHDRADWLAWGEHFYGRPWGEAPFLWSESYFYRRLLEAVGYFGSGAWCGVDPFAPVKNAELMGQTVDEELRALADLTGGPGDHHEALLVAALWGNRADLSFQLQLSATAAEARSEGILVDDSALLWSALGSQGGTDRLCRGRQRRTRTAGGSRPGRQLAHPALGSRDCAVRQATSLLRVGCDHGRCPGGHPTLEDRATSTRSPRSATDSGTLCAAADSRCARTGSSVHRWRSTTCLMSLPLNSPPPQ